MEEQIRRILPRQSKTKTGETTPSKPVLIFDDSIHQDYMDFHMKFMKAIIDEYQKEDKKYSNVITQLFEGELTFKRTCPICSRKIVTTDPITFLSIPLLYDVNKSNEITHQLQDLLNQETTGDCIF